MTEATINFWDDDEEFAIWLAGGVDKLSQWVKKVVMERLARERKRIEGKEPRVSEGPILISTAAAAKLCGGEGKFFYIVEKYKISPRLEKTVSRRNRDGSESTHLRREWSRPQLLKILNG